MNIRHVIKCAKDNPDLSLMLMRMADSLAAERMDMYYYYKACYWCVAFYRYSEPSIYAWKQLVHHYKIAYKLHELRR